MSNFEQYLYEIKKTYDSAKHRCPYCKRVMNSKKHMEYCLENPDNKGNDK